MTFSPMLAIPSTGASGRPAVTIGSLAGTHMFDVKHDGIRCWAMGDHLFNREGVDITHKYPEVVAALANSGDYGRLDGELVATDGRFETVLTRDKTERAVNIRAAVIAHPVRFIVFDMPTDELIRLPWWRRREALMQWHLTSADPDIILSPVSDDPCFIEQVAEMGLEGVIAKRVNAGYVQGKRSAHWVKFKNVQRVTCLVRKYVPGEGSRKHFGAMKLTLLGAGGKPVHVGTVGTGFTGRQTHELKALLDAGQELVVEIECLNITSGGLLRFPVYKGVRTDVQPQDCTIAQLDTLTRC